MCPLSEIEREQSRRFLEMYRTLLTPIALIVTVSGAFYTNLGSQTGKESPLVVYQLLIGLSVLLLIASAFLFGSAHMDPQRFHRRSNQSAFAFMMFAAFLSSSILVAPLASQGITGKDRALIVMIPFLGYLFIGVVWIAWFCRSRL